MITDKYRVWDDSICRYLYWEEIGEFYNLWNFLDWDSHHYTPEKNTGLKDCMGVDDYLRNIVQDVQTGCICTVEYGAYKTKSGTGFGWFLQHLDGEVYRPYPYDLEVWKIIGNIHENEDLLKED